MMTSRAAAIAAALLSVALTALARRRSPASCRSRAARAEAQRRAGAPVTDANVAERVLAARSKADQEALYDYYKAKAAAEEPRIAHFDQLFRAYMKLEGKMGRAAAAPRPRPAQGRAHVEAALRAARPEPPQPGVGGLLTLEGAALRSVDEVRIVTVHPLSVERCMNGQRSTSIRASAWTRSD